MAFPMLMPRGHFGDTGESWRDYFRVADHSGRSLVSYNALREEGQ